MQSLQAQNALAETILCTVDALPRQRLVTFAPEVVSQTIDIPRVEESSNALLYYTINDYALFRKIAKEKKERQRIRRKAQIQCRSYQQSQLPHGGDALTRLTHQVGSMAKIVHARLA